MRIDPRRLLDLLAVARHGSFSAAAEAMSVSQPGLSQSIAQLEHGLGGVRLLQRDRHGARLTPLGEALAFHARALEAVLRRAREDMELRGTGLAGDLAVGITPITTAQLVPQAVATLLGEAPDVGISLTEGLDDELLSMLRSREIDLIVCRLRLGLTPGLAQEPLSGAGLALIANPNHPLAQRDSLQLHELTGQRWVLPAAGSAFRLQMEHVFAAAGVPWPLGGINTNSVPAIKSIVMATDRVSLMAPALVAVECEARRLRAVPIVGVTPMQPVGMIWRQEDEASPLAARFMQILRDAAAGGLQG
jgi:DNA-binding transcriptional LysR family regulator